MAGIPRLRQLIVRLCPVAENWIKLKRGGDVLAIPSVVSLRKHFRGLEEVILRGMLRKYEDFLRAELMGPRKVSVAS